MRLFGRGRHGPDDGSRASGHDGLEHDRAGTDDAALRSTVEEVLLRELAAGALDDPDDAIPRPLSQARLVDWAKEVGLHHFVDSDGDLGWLWRQRRFAVLTLGDERDVLEVRGEWNRVIAIERLAEVLELCNEWNASRLWPRAFARVLDTGAVHVFARVTVPLHHGVTDDQLDQLVGVALHTSTAFFDTVDDVYPDPAGSAP
ncbi:putative sensory transduction regulator [Sediminihabitans luteus]|uniref:Putative sensory transduction regulator n=1 Tax=Sediminihabitans luteus TaxID=1138585 RepID=A0A2M9CCH3_9CELL|nr:YbjN domain-containing protein [Sediminihabitans luteus]PJJ69049.1 putative sensory transduction regulator [Sediminihabitans luteus]GII99435.1 hypothetical protein Slu03_18130 [Sediminihabitans luteus]